MYRKQLVAHVVSEMKKDVPDAAIRKALFAEGWTKDDVREAFYYAMYPENLERFSLGRMLDSEIPVYAAVISLGLSLGVFSLFFVTARGEMNRYEFYLSASPDVSAMKFEYGVQPSLSNPAFFERVKRQFVAEKVDFIEADLSAMKVRVYKEGAPILEEPIVTKGKPGSWWETPAGLYEIGSKEAEHFSAMGGVYMPYSMNFQGNFYIHGWPYYKGGKEVASTYSGGCIRLSTETAKKIFEEAAVGMPILVFEKDFGADGFSYEGKKPVLSAKEYLAADLSNHYVFIKSEGKAVPVASLTKLVTALVATEYIDLDANTTIPREAIVYTSKPRLKVGAEVSLYQLLFPLLLESSNEAAETISRYYGRSQFISRMNGKAKSIGMSESRFADPSGASPQNISTVDDLFMLAKYIYNNRSFVFKITTGKLTTSAYGDNGFTNLDNFNDFADESDFVGGKSGKTDAALETGLYVFRVNFGGEIRPIVVIVLNSENRKEDAMAILKYVKESFESPNVIN